MKNNWPWWKKRSHLGIRLQQTQSPLHIVAEFSPLLVNFCHWDNMVNSPSEVSCWRLRYHKESCNYNLMHAIVKWIYERCRVQTPETKTTIYLCHAIIIFSYMSIHLQLRLLVERYNTVRWSYRWQRAKECCCMLQPYQCQLIKWPGTKD